MTHDEAMALIPDLVQQRLGEAEKREAEQHTASCVECRRLIETYDTLRAAAVFERDGDHPTGDELVGHVLFPDAVATADRERIASHLAACPVCAEEVETTQRIEAEIGGDTVDPTVDAYRPPLWPLIAAGLLIGALAFPAYLGLFERSPDHDGEDGGAWSGAVSLPLLSASTRSTGRDVEIRVAPGQPVVPLAIDPELPGVVEPGAGYRFAIENAERVELWSHAMSTDEIAAKQRLSGVVVLLVPASILPTGEYRLTTSAGSGVVADSQFTIVVDR